MIVYMFIVMYVYMVGGVFVYIYSCLLVVSGHYGGLLEYIILGILVYDCIYDPIGGAGLVVLQ